MSIIELFQLFEEEEEEEEEEEGIIKNKLWPYFLICSAFKLGISNLKHTRC